MKSHQVICVLAVSKSKCLLWIAICLYLINLVCLSIHFFSFFNSKKVYLNHGKFFYWKPKWRFFPVTKCSMKILFFQDVQSHSDKPWIITTKLSGCATFWWFCCCIIMSQREWSMPGLGDTWSLRTSSLSTKLCKSGIQMVSCQIFMSLFNASTFFLFLNACVCVRKNFTNGLLVWRAGNCKQTKSDLLKMATTLS